MYFMDTPTGYVAVTISDDRAVKLKALQMEYSQLCRAPAQFDQIERGNRLSQVKSLCHRAYGLYERCSGREDEEAFWHAATTQI
jgi:hypothetical protein